ncbi:PAS domain S-box protein [Candidatus Fermentibacteria bacterium]|nr:PAS domain S-box protein [Candidatus Fermentibacteria bacterium]
MNEGVDNDAFHRFMLEGLNFEDGTLNPLLHHLGLRQVCLVDSDWRILFLVDSHRDAISKASDLLVGRNYLDLLPKRLVSDVKERLQINREGRISFFECRSGIRSPEPALRIRFSPVVRDGSYEGSVITAREASDAENGSERELEIANQRLQKKIEEHVATEEALRKGHELYRSILDNTLDVILSYDTEGLITYVSPNLKRYGYSPEEVLGKHVLDFVDPEDREKVTEDLERTLTTGEEFPTEFRMVGKDGSAVFMEERGRVIRKDGRIAGVNSVLRDVSGRKLAEQRLQGHRERLQDLVSERTSDLEEVNAWLKSEVEERKSAERMVEHLNRVLLSIRNVNEIITKQADRSALLEGACDSLVRSRGYKRAWLLLVDPKGRFDTVVQAGYDDGFETLRHAMAENDFPPCVPLLLDTPSMILFPEEREICDSCPLVSKIGNTDRIMGARLNYEGTTFGVLHVTCTGAESPGEDERTLFSDLTNDIAFALRNIELEKARNKAERALRRSEESYRTLYENVPLGVCRSLPQDGGKLVSANSRMALMFGYRDVSEMMAASCESLFEVPLGRKAFLEELYESRSVEGYEAKMKRRDGSTFWASISAKVGYDGESGDDPYVDAIIMDITERKLSADNLRESLEKLRKTIDGTVTAMSQLVDMKDPYTSGHQRAVADLAVAIGREMGLDDDRMDCLRIAGVLHDIGKLNVPSEILSKPGVLSQSEKSFLKMHAEAGYEILRTIEFPWPIAEIVRQHHERMDGSGYPHGLKGEEILLEARILAVADVVEATASHRPYRPSKGITTALSELEKDSGTLFDEELVEVCLDLFRKKDYNLVAK